MKVLGFLGLGLTIFEGFGVWALGSRALGLGCFRVSVVLGGSKHTYQTASAGL